MGKLFVGVQRSIKISTCCSVRPLKNNLNGTGFLDDHLGLADLSAEEPRSGASDAHDETKFLLRIDFFKRCT